MAAKTFKSHVATVRRPAKCFVGYTTIITFMDTGRELALFAPTKRQLLKAYKDHHPYTEIDPKRFQRVVYFDAKRITRGRALNG